MEKIKKINIIAGIVENNTSAMFNELIKDKDFKKLLFKELKNNNSVSSIADKLSKYVNKYLI